MINFKTEDGFYKTKIQIEKEVRELERKFDILCRIKDPVVTKKSSLKCLGKSSNKMGLYCHEEVRRLEADLKVAREALEEEKVFLWDVLRDQVFDTRNTIGLKSYFKTRITQIEEALEAIGETE